MIDPFVIFADWDNFKGFLMWLIPAAIVWCVLYVGRR